MMKYDDFLTVGLEAAKAAEAIILNEFSKTTHAFDDKPDNTPVTESDKKSEARIKEVILRRFPNHGFLGEETGNSNSNPDFTWIIDPIDGTKNFVRGIPLFATLIALMHQNQLVVGISNAPAMKECVYASLGNGAYQNDKKISVSKVNTLGRAYIGHAGIKYFKNINREEGLQTLIDSSWGSRGIGDAWAYHLVAQGKLDINIEAKVKIWDIAAPIVIIREAGGKVTDIEGNPITINSTSCLATNGLLHKNVVSVLNNI